MSLIDTFKHLMARRKLPPRPEGPLPDADSVDVISASGERLMGGETLVLYYTDSKGNESVRRIAVNKVDGTHVHAFCHERLANRSFRINGIRALASLDGEIYDNVADMLPVTPLASLGHLEPEMWPEEEQYFWHVEDAHERRFYALREEIKGEAVLLKAIARSDGDAHHTENAAIEAYVSERYNERNFKMNDAEAAVLRRWINSLFPEAFEVEAAVETLGQLSTDDIKRFLAACKSIVVAAVEVRKRGMGAMRMAQVPDYTGVSLAGFVRKHVARDAHLTTDGWAAYDQLEREGWPREKVISSHQPKGARHQLGMQAIHVVFGNLKTWLNGRYHGVSAKYLPRYLAEFCYRFNRRRRPPDLFGWVMRRLANGLPHTLKAIQTAEPCT